MPEHRPNRWFRMVLRQELPRWRAEGLVDARAEEVLSARYALADAGSAGFAIAALYVLAACLVGAGIISLVAWHWDEMSRWSRLAILGTALVTAHAAGHRMWQVTASQPRLGHAISLLGTLVFGASIGLVAQIFQVSGPWYGAFGAWAVGALAAGVVLPSLPALVLASVLATLVWAPGFIEDHARPGPLVAWAVGGCFVALSFRFRSRALFVASAVGLATALAAAAVAVTHPVVDRELLVVPVLLSAAAMACAFPAWASEGASAHLAAASAWLGRITFYALAYWLSFRFAAKHTVVPPGAGATWLVCAAPTALAALVLLLAGRRDVSEPRWVTAAIAVAFLPLFAIGFAGTVKAPLYLASVSNVALLALAAAWIAHGLSSMRRSPFWEGLAVAAVVAVSRFFEIERLLWLKGAGFIGLGVAVVAAALAFERRAHASEVSDA